MSLVHQKTKEKSMLRKAVVGMMTALCLIVVAACGSNASAGAASKTTISSYCKKMALGVGEKRTISLKNKKKGAKYTFKTSNKKIATVSSKGVVTPVSYGSAKITVTQTLKKKSSKVGTVSVTVKKAVLNSDYKNYFSYSSQTGLIESSPRQLFSKSEMIDYYNRKAKYTCYSGDKNKLKITTAGKVTYVSGTGSVKVTIKETYKKKTRVVGTTTVTLKKPSISSGKIVMNRKCSVNINSLTNDLKGCWLYFSDKADKPEDITNIANNGSKSGGNQTVLKAFCNNKGKWEGRVKALSAGVGYIHVYAYDYKQKKYLDSNYVGAIKVTVKENNDVQDVKIGPEADPDYSDYYEEEDEGYYDTKAKAYKINYGLVGVMTFIQNQSQAYIQVILLFQVQMRM